MKILMIGTPTCSKCKSIAPVIRKYAEDHKDISFQYMYLHEIPEEILAILNEKNVRQAPAFLIYREDDIVVVSGDAIFLELDIIK